MLNNNTLGIFTFCAAHAISSGYILVVTVLMLASASLAILFFLHRIKMHRSAALPPGPTPWSLLGNLPKMLRNKPRSRWLHNMMKEMDTDIACVRVGSVHIIPVSCPKIAREFLKKEDAIFASRPITMASELLSYGFKSVAVSPLGDHYKKMKKAVASSLLTTSNLRWLHDRREEEIDHLVCSLYNHCTNSGGVVNIRAISRAYAGNVMRRMIFNKRYFGEGRMDGFPGVEEEEYVEALFTVLSLLYAFCVSDYIPCLRMFDLDGHEKMIKAAIEIVNKYHDPIIDQRIKQWRDGSYSHNKEPQDLLDVLISLKDTNGDPLLSRDEIRAECADLIYASVDNTSNTVEWALAEMMNQPMILYRAIDEIDKVVGKERLTQESDLPKLNYVKACLRESFRLHPITFFNLPHMSIADASVAGYFIPKGSHVLLSRVGLGQNPNVWEDPLKFNPERHFTDSTTQMVNLSEPNLQFISFSTGRRGCIGVSLGSIMTVSLLTRLLQTFDLSMVHGNTCIDLSESPTSLFLAKSLHVLAKPRLHAQIYSNG